VPQAPSNAVVLWSVPPGLRPFAVSMSIVLTHLLGDVPSPPLLGAFQGLVDNWRCADSHSDASMFCHPRCGHTQEHAAGRLPMCKHDREPARD